MVLLADFLIRLFYFLSTKGSFDDAIVRKLKDYSRAYTLILNYFPDT
ncbi:hypothetical protein SAMN05444280_11689 [Tangfeifania diversioriginum]|uniref:Uncharacterized protein n=1 Tax=Tangfeifania diversioriginum TaxID=1168035 RepID=A0A1M6IFL5_9BACT|nr:hypothetical protein SAMN05444280_11689 [Tangfeifania diversioriginum]